MSPTSTSFAVAAPAPFSDDACVTARFLVLGVSDPSLLPRLVEPFSKLGAVPSRVHASCESGDGSQMSVDLRMSSVSARTAELIENALRRVVGVTHLIAVVEPIG